MHLSFRATQWGHCIAFSKHGMGRCLLPLLSSTSFPLKMCVVFWEVHRVFCKELGLVYYADLSIVGVQLFWHQNEVEGEEPLTVSSGFCSLSFFSCLRCPLSVEFLKDSLGVVLMGSNFTVFLANFNLFIFEFVGLFGPYMLLLKGNLNICLNDHQCYLDQSSILSCGLIFPFL